MSETDVGVVEKVGTAVIAAPVLALVYILLLPLYLFCAWCDLHVWNWFVAPYFHFPPIGLLPMLGLGQAIRLLTSDHAIYKDHEPKLGATIVNTTAAHVVTLLSAWAVHAWIVRHA